MTLRLHAPVPFRPIATWLSRLLVLLGILGIGLYVWSEADRWFYEWMDLDDLEKLEIAKPAPAVAPALTPLPSAKPDPRIIGQIDIPKLALKAIVRRGVDGTTLRRSVGHVPGTALPGEPGNSVLAGHRDTFFAALKNIGRGDLIRVHLRDGRTADYQVDQLAIVGRDAIEVMQTTRDTRLTLITCYPFDFIGPSPRRFIVSAAARVGD